MIGEVMGDRELDFYFPDHNLAIEANGDYWHSEKFGRDDEYHNDKTRRCNEKGIELVHIWESDFYNNQEYYKNLILNKLAKGTISSQK